MRAIINIQESKTSKIANYLNNPTVFKIKAAISLFTGFVGCIILVWSPVIFTLSIISNPLGLNVPYTELAMKMPERISYDIFALEKILVPLFFITFGISFVAGFKRLMPLIFAYFVKGILLFQLNIILQSY